MSYWPLQSEPRGAQKIVVGVGWLWLVWGYDQVLLDSMQGVDLGSQHSEYGPMDVTPGPLDFDTLEVPPPPPDNQVAAAWYDTDL
ncbi:Catenin beta-1 [Homalodisca vitripennis]|nr:Catenin beta-1 [Homalodisca vitripennis]